MIIVNNNNNDNKNIIRDKQRSTSRMNGRNDEVQGSEGEMKP